MNLPGRRRSRAWRLPASCGDRTGRPARAAPDCLSCGHASGRSGRRQRSRRAAPVGARVTPRKSPRSAGGRSPGPSRSCKDKEEPAP